METVSLDSPPFTLEGALRDAADGEVVFLTTGGSPRFASVAVDGGDREVLAHRLRAEVLAYLDESQLRAGRGPTGSLEDRKRLFSQDACSPGPKTPEAASVEGTTP